MFRDKKKLLKVKRITQRDIFLNVEKIFVTLTNEQMFSNEMLQILQLNNRQELTNAKIYDKPAMQQLNRWAMKFCGDVGRFIQQNNQHKKNHVDYTMHIYTNFIKESGELKYISPRTLLKLPQILDNLSSKEQFCIKDGFQDYKAKNVTCLQNVCLACNTAISEYLQSLPKIKLKKILDDANKNKLQKDELDKYFGAKILGLEIKKNNIEKVKWYLLKFCRFEPYLRGYLEKAVKKMGYKDQESKLILYAFKISLYIKNQNQLNYYVKSLFADYNNGFKLSIFISELENFAPQQQQPEWYFIKQLVIGLGEYYEKDFANNLKKIRHNVEKNANNKPVNNIILQGNEKLYALATIIFTQSELIDQQMMQKIISVNNIDSTKKLLRSDDLAKKVNGLIQFIQIENKKQILRYLLSSGEIYCFREKFIQLLEKGRNTNELKILSNLKTINNKSNSSLTQELQILLAIRKKLSDVYAVLGKQAKYLQQFIQYNPAKYSQHLYSSFITALAELKKLFSIPYIGGYKIIDIIVDYLKTDYYKLLSGDQKIKVDKLKYFKFQQACKSMLRLYLMEEGSKDEYKNNRDLAVLWHRISQGLILFGSDKIACNLLCKYQLVIKSFYIDLEKTLDKLTEKKNSNDLQLTVKKRKKYKNKRDSARLSKKNSLLRTIFLLKEITTKKRLYFDKFTISRAAILSQAMLQLLYVNQLDELTKLVSLFQSIYEVENKYPDIYKFIKEMLQTDSGDYSENKKKKHIHSNQVNLIYNKLNLLKIFRDVMIINNENIIWLTDNVAMYKFFANNYIYVVNMKLGLCGGTSVSIRMSLARKLLSKSPIFNLKNLTQPKFIKFLQQAVPKVNSNYEKNKSKRNQYIIKFLRFAYVFDDILVNAGKIFSNGLKMLINGSSSKQWKKSICENLLKTLVLASNEESVKVLSTEVFSYKLLLAYFLINFVPKLGSFALSYEQKNFSLIKKSFSQFENNMRFMKKIISHLNIFGKLKCNLQGKAQEKLYFTSVMHFWSEKSCEVGELDLGNYVSNKIKK